MVRKARLGHADEESSFDSTPISGPWGSMNNEVAPKESDDVACAFVSAVTEAIKEPQVEEKEQLYLHDIIANAMEAGERIPLPFSSSGRLIGTRNFGPMVVNIKKSPNVSVFADEPNMIKKDEVASSSCVLL